MPYKDKEVARKHKKEYHQKYYAENKDVILARTNKYHKDNKEKHADCMKRRRELRIDMINEVKLSYGCQNPDCLWSGEFLAIDLDLHHLDKNLKEHSIGYMASHSLEKLSREINKCTVLCACCHRRYHAGLIDSELQPCRVELVNKAIQVDRSEATGVALLVFEKRL